MKIGLLGVMSVGVAFLLITTEPVYADVWIAGSKQIAKIAPDGQTILASTGSVFGRRFSCSLRGLYDVIGVDQKDGSVWVSDCNNNRVFKLNSEGDPLFEVDLLSPIGIGIDPNDGSIWTSLLLNEVDFPRAVIKLDPRTGEELVRVTGFSRFVSSIAIGSKGHIWIADRFNNEVVVLAGTDEELSGYDTTGMSGIHHQRLGGFNEPLQIDVSPEDDAQGPGNVWVAGGISGIVKLAPDGAELVRKRPPGLS